MREGVVVIPNMAEVREEAYSGMRTAYIITSIFIFLWVAVGIAAFIMSILCFGRSGSNSQHIVGILLSIFFGPFYWIYFLAVKSYCQPLGSRSRGSRK